VYSQRFRASGSPPELRTAHFSLRGILTYGSSRDTAPLSARQLRALAGATLRELIWGLRAVSEEVHGWRSRAYAIPDKIIREDALSSLSNKRGNTDGAALFWILPCHRDINLLRILVAYEIMADYLDSINERAAFAGMGNGLQLHLALVEALDPEIPISDYYSRHPWRDDGGYLRALVQTCREGCALLPSYECVRSLTIRAANAARVQALNHELDPDRRDRALKDYAERELAEFDDLDWFELTAARSAWLTVLAMLALAAEPAIEDRHGLHTYTAYLWICLAATMLDSYTDMEEDAANESHSYVGHYASREFATGRVRELLGRATREAQGLPRANQHLVILCSMIALYLSKDSARTPAMRPGTRGLVRAGGSLSRSLLPILRTWRIAYSQRSA
jgi:tetraprenyl-beta-curcumene synthase